MEHDKSKLEQPTIEHQINIELGEQEAQGIYSNLVIISHSIAEFVLDFTRVLPGLPRARVHARILMTPQHAKLFWMALGENIRKYEQQYGEIRVEPQQSMPSIPFRVH
ncbi:MAG: DUF3467 domain-containing protein [Candidatus Kapabacteria bacterium]|nr:DUF3467 domain-containing protein [Candidatus Kapabacteria bacterium]MDW8011920.1 DUF3467 domain-containing protein [Bacteroidota bacterium]